MSINMDFTIIDIETTGLYPGGYDRIIEFAGIRMDSEGNIKNVFQTLINPERDVGPTHIHGIRARDVQNAPKFKDIAGNIITLMNGAIVVAHNAQFDTRFIYQEMENAGYRIPNFPTLCTMSLARKVDPAIPGRKLEILCDYFDVKIGKSHVAYNDARAAYELLKIFLERLRKRGDLNPDILEIKGNLYDEIPWPIIPPNNKSYWRQNVEQEIEREESFLKTLINRLPSSTTDNSDLEEYLMLLDEVLEDRVISDEEIKALQLFAKEVGLDRETAMAAHREYMKDLLRLAWADGVITLAEQDDLERVRHLLGISKELFQEISDQMKQDESKPKSSTMSDDYWLDKSICFTGQMVTPSGNVISRNEIQDIARQKGMHAKSGVTKKLDILVIADPDSMSSKAVKARELGTRIIAAAAFFNMIGIE